MVVSTWTYLKKYLFRYDFPGEQGTTPQGDISPPPFRSPTSIPRLAWNWWRHPNCRRRLLLYGSWHRANIMSRTMTRSFDLLLYFISHIISVDHPSSYISRLSGHRNLSQNTDYHKRNTWIRNNTQIVCRKLCLQIHSVGVLEIFQQ